MRARSKGPRSRRSAALAGKTIFIDITIRADRGRPTDLKPYFEAANHAVMQLAIDNHAFCGVVGRRVVVSERQMSRHMYRHKFYRKAKWR